MKPIRITPDNIEALYAGELGLAAVGGDPLPHLNPGVRRFTEGEIEDMADRLYARRYLTHSRAECRDLFRLMDRRTPLKVVK